MTKTGFRLKIICWLASITTLDMMLLSRLYKSFIVGVAFLARATYPICILFHCPCSSIIYFHLTWEAKKDSCFIRTTKQGLDSMDRLRKGVCKGEVHIIEHI